MLACDSTKIMAEEPGEQLASMVSGGLLLDVYGLLDFMFALSYYLNDS